MRGSQLIGLRVAYCDVSAVAACDFAGNAPLRKQCGKFGALGSIARVLPRRRTKDARAPPYLGHRAGRGVL